MTKEEMKEAWNSVDHSIGRWYSKPLGWSLAIFSIVTCLLGQHSEEQFKTGIQCIYCGKIRKNKV